jgi:DNA-binding FadR family transcriptional regulator
MEFKEIVSPTRKGLFINEMERMILSNELKIGEKLPPEREMEKKMKVSRSVINAGLTELARCGFVEIIPRKGIYVCDYCVNGTLDTLLSVVNFNGGKLNEKQFHDLMEYRLINECEAASLAATNRSEEDLARLQNVYERIQQSQSTEEVIYLRLEFSKALFCATGNIFYPMIYNSFNKLCVVFNEKIYRKFGLETATLYLADLLQAIESKQPEKARTIARKMVSVKIEEISQEYLV